MARHKTLPESVRAKYALAERLSTLRAELFGDRGGPELARKLGLPIRTWYNYESGVTVPAEVVLKIIELTSVEPLWLLHGKGAKFRQPVTERHEAVIGPVPSVGALLRTALELLEQRVEAAARSGGGAAKGSEHALERNHSGPTPEIVLIGVEETPGAPSTKTSGPRYVAARGEWLDAEHDCRCIRVVGDAMSPIVSDGAYAAFSEIKEDLNDLDGKMVVAWVDEQPIVRWFKHHGRFGLLRAENSATDPAQLVLDVEERPGEYRLRRVLWINTPH